MSTAEITLCAVCRSPAENATECRCGAVYCRVCTDGHECAPMREIVLRDYQCGLNRGVFDMIRDGHRTIIAVLPTGAGKRIWFAWLTRKAAIDQGKRVLFVVNRRTLTTQFSDELTAIGIPHNIMMGSDTTADRGEPVVVASLATLRKRHFFHPDTGKTDGTGLPPADLLLIDEAHLDASSYRKLFEFYPDAIKIGNTATPVGSAGKSLSGVWPAMYVGISKSELIARKCLVPTKMYAPSEPDMTGVKITSRNAPEVEKRIRECTVFANVFREWQPWSDLPTVVFAPGVEFARWMAQEFNRRGYMAVCVDAKTKKRERRKIFDGVNDGSIRVVVSVDVLKVGVDCPRWKCAIDMQVTNQLRDFYQKAGRICRADGDSTECVYLDMAGNWWKHGHCDADVAWDQLTGNERIEELVASARAKPGAPKEIRCPKCTHVRKFGDKCPQCGFTYAKQTREVQMGDGRLVKKPAPKPKEKKAPTAKGTPEWRAQHWRGALYAAGGSNKTLAQARHIYKDKAGEWPPGDIVLHIGRESVAMPVQGSLDWNRKVGDLYPWAGKRKRKASA